MTGRAGRGELEIMPRLVDKRHIGTISDDHEGVTEGAMLIPRI
jgi:hypothetical protein